RVGVPRRRGRGAELAVGLMSGTSADGIDAALVEIAGVGHAPACRTLATHTTPYSRALRDRLLRLPDVDARELARLHVLLGERFATAALDVMRRGRVAPKDVAFVASHGHTAVHLPSRE